MVRSFATAFLLTIFLYPGCAVKKERTPAPDTMSFISRQMNNTIKEQQDPTKIPRTLLSDGRLRTVNIYNWASGFFAGNLWFMYGLTGDAKWKKEAVKWTEVLDTIQYFSGHHDVGFMINCSYGNGLDIGGIDRYEQVMVQAAASLSKRYNEKVGAIKSWDYNKSWDGETEWFYPVIIDNMMNLELLFKASEISGDPKYYQIAVRHAETTMANHYRDDFSSYHVVDYDSITGKVNDRATAQGFTDSSSWARGQAWGIYGFVMTYRFTKDRRYLEFAERIAQYMLNHPKMPDDKVPYWDYQAGEAGLNPGWDYDPELFKTIPRDVSAAAITASALYELGRYSGKTYRKAADEILQSLLSDKYLARDNPYFILDHSVGSIPHGVEIDVPLVFADYYFLEALYRKYRY